MTKKELFDKTQSLLEEEKGKKVREYDCAVPMNQDGSYPHNGLAYAVYYEDNSAEIVPQRTIEVMYRNSLRKNSFKCSCRGNKFMFSLSPLMVICNNCFKEYKLK